MFRSARDADCVWLSIALAVTGALTSCGSRPMAAKTASEGQERPTVSVVKAVRKTLQRSLQVSSELVPFQQIDVYAKESGFVHDLDVDYGSHVKKGQVLAILEIPELQLQLEEDQAEIKNSEGEVASAQDDLDRIRAQQKVTHPSPPAAC